MDENKGSVSFVQSVEEVAKEVLNWDELTSYEEDPTRLVLIFNLKFVVIRKESLRGDLDLLKMLLDKFSKNEL